MFMCRGMCGRWVTVNEVYTLKPDAGSKLLHRFMENLEKMAYCPDCLRKKNYLAALGRSREFVETPSKVVFVGGRDESKSV